MKKINGLLIFVFVLAAIFLASMATGTMGKMQAILLQWVGPFLKTGTVVRNELGGIGQGLKTLEQLEAENRKLEVENRKLRALSQTLRDVEAENNRLRIALDYRERSAFRLVPAQVISRDASTWWHTIKVNRGFEDGIEQDSPVITDIGLVGKVITVSKNESIVMLITDELCKVGAYVEGVAASGKREKGIVNGLRVQETATGELQMNFLSKEANLQGGQKIYSEGVGGVFPPGLLLGVVKSFRPRELDGQAILQPAVDFATLSDVFVIVGEKS